MSSTPEDVIMDDEQLTQSSSNANNAHGEASNTPADSANDTTDVPMADDNDEDGMPGLEPVDDLPPSRRRGRVLEDGDQDRDRRHPATRAAERDSRAGTPAGESSDAPANASTTTPSTDLPLPHTDHPHHQPPADDPILNNPLSALISRTMRDFVRQTQAADRAHAPHPPVPTLADILRRDIAGVTGQGPPTVNHNFFAGLFGVDPIPPNTPPTTQAGHPSDQAPATQPLNPQNPTPHTNANPHPPPTNNPSPINTNNQPPPATPQPPTNPLAALFGAFTGNGNPNAANPFANLPNLPFAPTFDLASLYPPPERDDPAKAKQIIDALEEVPVGLVQRLERVSPEGNGCAICWEGLLEWGGGGWNTQGGDDKGGEGTSHTAANAGGGGGEADATSAGGAGGEGAVDSSATANGSTTTPTPTSQTTSTTSTQTTPTPPRIVALPCSHVFHADCLVPWFSRPRQTTCPTCGIPIGGFTIPIPGNANAAQPGGAQGGTANEPFNPAAGGAGVRGAMDATGQPQAAGGPNHNAGAQNNPSAGAQNNPSAGAQNNPSAGAQNNPSAGAQNDRPPLARLMDELLHGPLGEALGQRGDALRAQGIDPASVLPGGPASVLPGGPAMPAATPAAGAGAAAGVAGSQAPGVATQAAPGPAPATRGRGRRPNPAAELFPGYTPAQQEQMASWVEAMMRSIFGGPPSGVSMGAGSGGLGGRGRGGQGQAARSAATTNAAPRPPQPAAAPQPQATPQPESAPPPQQQPQAPPPTAAPQQSQAPPPPHNANAPPQPNTNAHQMPPNNFTIPFPGGAISIGFDMFLQPIGGEGDGMDGMEEDGDEGEAMDEDEPDNGPNAAHGDHQGPDGNGPADVGDGVGDLNQHEGDPDPHDTHALPFTPLLPGLQGSGYHYHPTPDGRGVTLVGPGGEDTGMDFFLEGAGPGVGGGMGGMGGGIPLAAFGMPHGQMGGGQQGHEPASNGAAQAQAPQGAAQAPQPTQAPQTQPTQPPPQPGTMAHLQETLRNGIQAAFGQAFGDPGAVERMAAVREELRRGDEAVRERANGTQPTAAAGSNGTQQATQPAGGPQVGAGQQGGAQQGQAGGQGAQPFPIRLPGMEGLAIPLGGAIPLGLGLGGAGINLGGAGLNLGGAQAGVGRPPWLAGGFFGSAPAPGNTAPQPANNAPPPTNNPAPATNANAQPPTNNANPPPPATNANTIPPPATNDDPNQPQLIDTFTATATARILFPAGGGPPQVILEGITPPERVGGQAGNGATGGVGAGAGPTNADPHAGANANAAPNPNPATPTDAPPRRRTARMSTGGIRPEPRPRRQWTLPAPPGPSVREVVEKREREAGLRCSDHSCGVGPSDEDPMVEVGEGDRRQIRILRDNGEYTCEHLLHPPCLVSAQRVALRGAEETRVNGRVEVACPVCRAEGTIAVEDWEEGVRRLEAV
ncbi:hypothetical protein EV122DRAFT_279218 [Schizophyllum commune]